MPLKRFPIKKQFQNSYPNSKAPTQSLTRKCISSPQDNQGKSEMFADPLELELQAGNILFFSMESTPSLLNN